MELLLKNQRHEAVGKKTRNARPKGSFLYRNDRSFPVFSFFSLVFVLESE